MKPWYQADPEGFEAFKKTLAVEYPTLHVYVERGRVFVRGTLFLHDGKTEIDHYQIELEIPGSFPDALPKLREVGGRVPRIADRHIDPETGDACPLLPDQRHEFFPKAMSVLGFIKGPVENFFLLQTYYEKKKSWPNEQWGHGAKGIVAYYREVFGTSDEHVVTTGLRYLARKKLKGHWPCYCGSGEPLRRCHLELIACLRDQIPRKVASQSLDRVLQQQARRYR